jgi:ribosome recycling factor
MIDLVFEELKEDMERYIRSLEKSFNQVRTGRASVSLLDGIKVDYYGTPTPLNQLASLSAPESQMILIAPWDKSAIGSIEKSVQKSNLGLVPTNDGKAIRINIPPLTEDRRKELVKVVKKMAEDCKVKLRNARREANNNLKNMQKNSEISEDDLYQRQDEVQKTTDDYIKKADGVLEKKEAEIMEI